jgi:hypothetical protein
MRVGEGDERQPFRSSAEPDSVEPIGIAEPAKL